jgi:succinate dehydrogenase / fumarate reductase, cytochrome b subunit
LSQVQSRLELLSREHRAFLWRKLHSLAGVVPVGVFLMAHLWTNARALGGQQGFEAAVSSGSRLPYRAVVEVVGLGLPLLVHASLGLSILLGMRQNLRRYPTTRNAMYVAQRVSGVVAFAFIAYHLWHLRLQVALGKLDQADFFPTLCGSLSSTVGPGLPLVAVAYLVGVAAAVFHFANGLYGFCFSWGITGSRRAARLAAGVFGLVGVVLFVVGANTVIYFATGTRLLFSAPTDPVDAPAVSCRDLRAGAGEAAAPGSTAVIRRPTAPGAAR